MAKSLRRASLRQSRTTGKSSRCISAPTPRKSSRRWPPAMLKIENVSAGYEGFQALFGVSLEVSAGESVAVIGPNGAGKTTLLRAISKLINVTGGDIAMEGRSLKGVP